jgi:ABC-type antimicrobial peptide transport system permease subunit
VSLVVLVITLFSALLAVRRLRSIYPLEAFT